MAADLIYIVSIFYGKIQASKRIFIVETPYNKMVTMSETQGIEQKFKVGVLKELHRRNLITSEELERAIKMIKKITKC